MRLVRGLERFLDHFKVKSHVLVRRVGLEEARFDMFWRGEFDFDLLRVFLDCLFKVKKCSPKNV